MGLSTVVRVRKPIRINQQILLSLVGLDVLMTVLFPVLFYKGQDVLWQTVGFGLVLFAVSMAVAFLITRQITRPLRQLTETIQGITEGRTDRVAAERGSYEQVLLARQFNLMNRALQDKISESETARLRLIELHDTERKQADVERRMSERRYRGLLNFAVDGILIGTHEGIVIEANECICTLFGRARSDLLGKHLSEMPFTPESVRRAPFRFDLLQRGEKVVSERTIRRSDGSEIVVEMHSKMMTDGSYQSIYHEITERKQTEIFLSEVRGLLEEAQSMAKLGGWRYDIVTRQAKWTNEVYRILGVDYDFNISDLEGLVNRFSPKDRLIFSRALQRAIEQGEPYELEFEYIRPTGESVWVLTSARAVIEKGRIVRLTGNVMDITERKKAREVLQSWNTDLERQVAERTAEAERRTRQLKALTERLIRVEEDERLRIADVLHENLQQVLVAARMALELAIRPVKDVATITMLRRVDGMLEESFRLTRSLVQEIAVPAVREGDLPFVIKCVTQQVQEKFGLEVKLTVDEMMPPVSKNVYLCLYRAIQELLFNSIKHAHVQQVDVSVRKADGQSVQVIVKDKGPGFLMNKLDETGQAGTGFGLYNIRERVEGLGGSMEIVSGEGQGTTVILIVPVQDASV